MATVRAGNQEPSTVEGKGGAGSLPGLSEAVTLQSGNGFEILPNPRQQPQDQGLRQKVLRVPNTGTEGVNLEKGGAEGGFH